MYRKEITIVAGSLVVGGNLLVGLFLDNLLFGFSAIAFAIIFHAQSTE